MAVSTLTLAMAMDIQLQVLHQRRPTRQQMYVTRTEESIHDHRVHVTVRQPAHAQGLALSAQTMHLPTSRVRQHLHLYNIRRHAQRHLEIMEAAVVRHTQRAHHVSRQDLTHLADLPTSRVRSQHLALHRIATHHRVLHQVRRAAIVLAAVIHQALAILEEVTHRVEEAIHRVAVVHQVVVVTHQAVVVQVAEDVNRSLKKIGCIDT